MADTIFNPAKPARRDLSNDDLIIEILRNSAKPLPPSTIAYISGMSMSKLSQRLRQLSEKYRVLKVAYRRTLPFYQMAGKNRK